MLNKATNLLLAITNCQVKANKTSMRTTQDHCKVWSYLSSSWQAFSPLSFCVSELHIEAQQHRGEDEVSHLEGRGTRGLGWGNSLVNPDTERG